MTMSSNATWVVYLKTIHKRARAERQPAVCEQVEWNAMERLRPGYHELVQTGIATENEAEDLARRQSGRTCPLKDPTCNLT